MSENYPLGKLPPNIKFGKLPQRVDKRTIQLKTVFMLQNLPPLPLTYDVDSEFTAFNDNHMYGNDIYGDCVIAGRGHMTLRLEDFEQKILISITDKEIENEYFAETGGSDDGLVMLDSLNLWRKSGWTAAGKAYNIYAYAQLDIQNHNELMYSCYLLRGAYVGFNVPQSAIDQFNAGQAWTVSGDNTIVGGHCVYIVGYNATGPVCVTWGQKQQMDWKFWDTYFDEAYAVIDNIDSWMNPATDPVNIATLQQELNDITSNPIPPPPIPPPPPVVTYTLKVVSAQGSPTPSVGSHTYNEQTAVVCNVVSPVVVSGVSYTCTGWTGTGSVPAKGTTFTITFAIIANSTITWNWVTTPIPPPTAYNLTVVSAHGNPSPSVGVHPYNNGASVTCSIASPVVVNGVSYTCTGWTLIVTGSVPVSGSALNVTFVIRGNSTITWNWIATPTPPPNIWQEILDLLNKIWAYIQTHSLTEETSQKHFGEMEP